MKLTRRTVIHSAASVALAPALGILRPIGAAAQAPGPIPAAASGAPQWRHALSLFDEIRYPADFKHFDYVNPQAPKGGTARMIAFGTFDNFNRVIAGVKGSFAQGAALISESLTTASMDEVSTEYGQLAEAVSYPADYSTVTYRLRAAARWHDGKPVTVDDVIYSLDVMKKNSPFFGAYYRHVTKAEQTGEREVTFTFDQPGNRELPQIVGQLIVLPKHWWTGKDRNGNPRDVTATTLEPPLGSGPYRIKEFVAGRSVVLERVKDHWGKDLGVNAGTNNFDQIRFEYFRDTTVALEAFKADQVDWRSENSAKNWATAYAFPAVRDKRVVLEEFAIRNVGRMQGFVFNTRREKFSDPRVRRAFNFAFDFEEMNKQLFFGQYKRIASYFEGTELASSGVPEGAELAILETVRDKVPAELFTSPYTTPVSGDPQKVRTNLREAIRLLKEAGYEVKNQKLTNTKTNEPFSVEFLVSDPNSERFVLFYKPSLERLGMTVTVRTVDDVQYENRLRQWDYDIITAVWPQSLSPGNEQREFWSSASAERQGSRNYAGIRNPAVDALIERVIFTKDRAELVAATKALDRVLLWNFYVVPQWTYPFERSARWDRFGRPQTMPKYGQSAFPTIWWWDAEKAAKVPVRS
ncbi:MAG: extracellular solute-binding protein [Pseudolabrys sp.]